MIRYDLDCEEGPDALWEVRHVELYEALSEPYRLELECVTEQLDVDVTELLGCSCELLIDRGGLARSVCGIISQLECLGQGSDRLAVRIRVEPALTLLGQRVDTRAWQHLSVPDLVAEVLAPALREYGRTLDVSGLGRDYAPREYVVQYNESDLDFVSRLLEDAGINYWFDHAGDERCERMMLEDGERSWLMATSYGAEDEDTPLIPTDAVAEREGLHAFELARTLTPTRVHRRVFDWRTPTQPLEAHAELGPSEGGDEHGRVREIYVHELGGAGEIEGEVEARAQRELAAAMTWGARFSGRSNVVDFAPGRVFRVLDPERPELEGEYLIRRIWHRGACQEVEGGEDSDDPGYANRFECVAYQGWSVVPERRTPKPRACGPQLAIVTGPEGEEIHTDEFGRVKVRFDWDRRHGLSDDTSMWIRVAQTWAGPGFGTVMIPRVGMEVVVEFLDGDPDKPLITGCVYNGDNFTNMPLSEAATRSGLRTQSSPGGEGFNELAFEDAAGAEAIELHAQRDLLETIRHVHATQVGADRLVEVGGSESRTVGGDREHSVLGSASSSVDGHLGEFVGGVRNSVVAGDLVTKIGGDCQHFVLGSQVEYVAGDSVSVTEGSSQTKISGDAVVEVAGSQIVSAGEQLILTQGEGENVFRFGEGEVSTSAERQVAMQAGIASVVVFSAPPVAPPEPAPEAPASGEVAREGAKKVGRGIGKLFRSMVDGPADEDDPKVGHSHAIHSNPGKSGAGKSDVIRSTSAQLPPPPRRHP